MSSVSYRGYRLVPAPFFTIEKQYNTTADGKILGSLFNISILGKMVSWKGSPTSSGTFWNLGGFPPDETSIRDDSDQRLKATLRKQEAIRQLFAVEGGSLELQSADGSAPMKCNPRLRNIRFAEGSWYEVSDYQIDLEADSFYGGSFIAPSGEDGFVEKIRDFSESWTVELNDQPEFAGQTTLDFQTNQSYRLTHNISAVGKRFYNENGTLAKQAWEQAREYVQPRLGFDQERAMASGVLNLPAYYNGFDHLRSETVDEAGGTYSVTETWVVTSGTALEDFTINIRKGIESDIVSVSIDGRITGLSTRDSDYGLVQGKYTAAELKFAAVSGSLMGRAQQFSGYTLNAIPISEVQTRSPTQGIITYTYEFDTRPSQIIPGAKSEVLNISDNLQGDVFAEIPVLGRAAGPVLQSIGTRTARRRTLSLQAVFPKVSPTSAVASLAAAFNGNPRLAGASAPVIDNIIVAASPSQLGFSTYYQTEPQENWEPLRGVYSYSTSWVFSN